MGLIAVLLDSSPTAQHAAYFSYHIAARSGSRLAGVAVLNLQSLENSDLALNEFRIGARAARANVRTAILNSLSVGALRAELPEVELLVMGVETLAHNPAVKGFLAESPWPVWLVPEQRSIRRALVIFRPPPAASAALPAGIDISRRWHLELSIQVIRQGEAQPLSIPGLSAPGGQLLDAPQFDSREIKKLIQAEKIDLLLLDRAQLAENQWDLSCCQSCVTAIYPPPAG